MTKARVDQICRAKEQSEDELRSDDSSPEEPTRLPQLHERHEVHPLILRLLQKSVDPPVVAFHESQRPEVAPRGGRHSRNSRHGLEEDAASYRVSLSQSPAPVFEGITGEEIEAGTH